MQTSFAAASALFLFSVCSALAPVAAAEVTVSPALAALAEGFRAPPDAARPSAYWLWLNGYYNRDHAERELRALYDAGLRGVCIFDMGARGNQAACPPAGPPFLSEQSVADIAHAVQTAERLGMDVQLSVASSWDMGGSWVQPQHASMGLYRTETSVRGPAQFDAPLPFPPVPERAPRNEDGSPAFVKEVAVLAVQADQPMPGHDFVFQLDPPGLRTLDHAVLYNTRSDDPGRHGDLQLFSKDFSIAVSDASSEDASFREILRGSLEPHTDPQRFDLPSVAAGYVRLRIFSGHYPDVDRVTLGEFELFDTEGVNVVASHVADRSRDGAKLLGYRSALGHNRTWSAENIHDGAYSGAGGSWSSAGPPPLRIDSLDAIIDLSDRIRADGHLQWTVPAGQWTIMRFVCLNTGERLKVPSPQSDGLATDHFSSEATETFLKYLTGRLESVLGDLGPTALKQLYLASYEVRGPIWTPGMLTEFARYRGYDLKPYLPVLTGHIVVDDQVTSRFIYDYRKTLGDLLVDAYYRAAVRSAHAAGLGVESEAGGPGPPIHQVPVDALRALGVLDEVRGEFWPKRPDANRLWVVKETACAAHIYGKRRVHMEAFTSMHHWQDGPLDLKPSADRAFCEGANHFVWHTSSHAPPEAGQPGWAYLAGTHLNPNLVWWSQAPAFIDYLARCSYLLQQGLFVADVCYYYGDQGYNFVPPKHVGPSPGFGFDYDVANRDVILTRMSVKDGRLVLPDGMSYALLVLPDRPDIDPDVLRKLEELIDAGATVVGPKPTRSTGLTGYPDGDDKVCQLADRIWGPCDGQAVLNHDYGQGRIYWGRTPREILAQQGTGPDFACDRPESEQQCDFVHRRAGDVDIYFVRNKEDGWRTFTATFRVTDAVPELWDPATGLRTPQHAYRVTDAGISLPLQLAPHGSVFVVLRPITDEDHDPVVSKRVSEPLGPGSRYAVSQPDAAQVTDWDGRTARILVSSPGTYLLRCADGRRGQVVVRSMPTELALEGPWNVRFTAGPKRPDDAVLERLISWTEHPSDDVRYFSGIARYALQFDLPENWLGGGGRVQLDLGRLWAVGEVYVNGQSLGVVWKPPFAVDVSGAVRAGRNELAVEVANTWSNRLVGDAALPLAERVTGTNVPSTGGLPWKETPLLPSGLLGPVRLAPKRLVTVTVAED